MEEIVYQFKFVGTAPEGVTAEQLSTLVDCAKQVALEGLPRIWGHEYEDDHIIVQYGKEEITVTRKREDEAGQPITEVMNLYREDKNNPGYSVYTLRPGAWMHYLTALDMLINDADAEADYQGMKMMDHAFTPVQDDDLRGVTPVLRERSQAEYDAADMRVELRRVHLKMNRIMKALGIEDYWNAE